MVASRSRPSPDLLTHAARWFAQRVPVDSRVCVALSGGRDSVALLHLAWQLAGRHPFSLSALHVHHGLSPNADRWASYCAQLCEALQVPLTVRHVSVARDGKAGLEAAARDARYAAFADADAEIILLAHHRNDQAETILFNLLRGTGVTGARGMRSERVLRRPGRPALRLLRPLLEMPVLAIAEWVERLGLTHIDDESNADCRYSRNFLRHQVLPLMESRFPGASGQLASAGARFAEASELLDELAQMDALSASDNGAIRQVAFASLTPARARNLLRYLIVSAGGRIPSEERLTEATRQLQEADSGALPAIAFGDLVVRAWRDHVYLMPSALAPVVAPQVWCGQSEVAWGDGLIRVTRTTGDGLSLTGLNLASVEFGLRQGGERMRLSATRPAKPLKDWFQEQNVPPWLRDSAPVLRVNGEVAWVGALGVDHCFQAKPGEEGWSLAWHPSAGLPGSDQP